MSGRSDLIVRAPGGHVGPADGQAPGWRGAWNPLLALTRTRLGDTA